MWGIFGCDAVAACFSLNGGGMFFPLTAGDLCLYYKYEFVALYVLPYVMA